MIMSSKTSKNNDKILENRMVYGTHITVVAFSGNTFRFNLTFPVTTGRPMVVALLKKLNIHRVASGRTARCRSS